MANKTSSPTSTTISQFQKGISGCATWQLKEWSECHKYLAAHCSCILKVGNVILRFFLRPIQKTFSHNEKVMLTLDYYSLWVQVISKQTNLFFNVMTILSHGEENYDKEVETFDTQCVLNRQFSEGDSMLLVEELFICMQETHVDLQTLFGGYTYRECKNRRLYAIRTSEFMTLQICMFDYTESTNVYHAVLLKMKDNVVLQGHRYILAARSPVFKAMFSSDMKESVDNTINIPDIGSKAMKVILNYIYTERIDEGWKENVDDVVHGASKYDLKALLEHCDRNMVKICNVNNAIDLFRVAKLYSLKEAMNRLTEFTQRHTAQVLLCMGGE